MLLPDKYQGLSEDELKTRIADAKARLGKDLVILGHHYQRDNVYNFADFTGDSFKLAQDAANQKDSKYIVFCGVNFMAESARILCSDDQRVFIPDMDAGCPMAAMADIDEVENAWDDLAKMTDVSKIIPVTYMNSTAATKAFCGQHDGAVCTSSNAKKIFEWAFKRGEKILFLPDEHLGRNTARAMGIEDVALWKRDELNGGLTNAEVEKSKVMVWNGYCHVHKIFTVEQVNEARKRYPGCQVVVHPECTEDVVKASDTTGSTEQIKKYIDNAPAGSVIVVGTEVNMVSRMAANNPDKRVVPLTRSLCPNMFKVSMNDLCWILEEIGQAGEIIVDESIKKDARVALERMLANG